MRFMLLKELRENAKWLAVGLVLTSVLAWAALPTSISDYENSLRPYLGFAGALFAILLGFMQSTWDFSDRQRGFLLHRTLSKRQVLFAKLLAGAIIYSIVMGVPLTLAAIYFAIMGPESLPVRPLQVVAPALLVTLCFFLHPISMGMQLRSAKWFGTKAAPLVLPVSLCYFFYLVHDNRWQSWLMFVVLSLILAGLSSSIISRSAERLSIVANSLAAVTIALALCSAYLLSNQRILSYNEPLMSQGVDDEGTLWQFRYRQKYDEQSRLVSREILSGGPVKPGSQPDLEATIPAQLPLNSLSSLVQLTQPSKNYGEIRRVAGLGNIIIFWDESGYFRVYDTDFNKGLVGTITRDGFSPGSGPNGHRFSSCPLEQSIELRFVGNSEEAPYGIYPSFLLANSDGVFLLNQATGDLRVVVEKPIFASTSLLSGEKYSDSFLIKTKDGLERYQLQLAVPPDRKAKDKYLDLKQISFAKIATYPNLPQDTAISCSIGASSSGKLVALTETSRGHYSLATLASPEQKQWQIQPVQIIPQRTLLDDRLPAFMAILGALPLALFATVGTVILINLTATDRLTPLMSFFADETTQKPFVVYVIALAILTTIALALTYVALARRATDRKLILLWLVLTIPLGIAAPLAILAIYPKLTFDRCPKCNRNRRVDSNKCEHCGSDWEGLPPQGIEIIEGKNQLTATSPY